MRQNARLLLIAADLQACGGPNPSSPWVQAEPRCFSNWARGFAVFVRAPRPGGGYLANNRRTRAARRRSGIFTPSAPTLATGDIRRDPPGLIMLLKAEQLRQLVDGNPPCLVAFLYCLFLAAAGGVGRIFAQGSVFPASGTSLSFDRYSRSMALSYSFCSLVREGASFLRCTPGRNGAEPEFS
jgi:hypothetical protein